MQLNLLKENPPQRIGAGRAPKSNQLGSNIRQNEHRPGLAENQIRGGRYLARRFRMEPRTARLIATLSGIGGRDHG